MLGTAAPWNPAALAALTVGARPPSNSKFLAKAAWLTHAWPSPKEAKLLV